MKNCRISKSTWKPLQHWNQSDAWNSLKSLKWIQTEKDQREIHSMAEPVVHFNAKRDDEQRRICIINEAASKGCNPEKKN